MELLCKKPAVSVVIPTRNRPRLVHRAVESVIKQTYSDLEIIVVIDGPDLETGNLLETIEDPRLRVVALEKSLGGAGTRNTGVTNSLGRWVAFLDDDDEWLPNKLERQLYVAEHSIHRYPIVSSRLIARSPNADFIWPNTAPYEPIADYLMQRKGMFQGDGLIQTSTILVSAELMRKCPFNEGLKKHQDWDWLIRAMAREGAGIDFVGDPLVVWYIEENRSAISASVDWHFSMNWLDSVKEHCSMAAYSTFLLTVLGAYAANQGDWGAFFPILMKASNTGEAKARHVLLYIAMWLLPRNIRHQIRAICIGRSQKKPSTLLCHAAPLG
jgi:glycosyltransferase involved in cell wall biosynthesis